MKTPSDELHSLIKSLIGQEKRYFKIYASRHVIGDDNKYMLLFDAVAQQESYDEVAIKRMFSKHSFIRQLTVMKNYLYEMVLKSLDSYNAEKSIDNQLNRQLHYAEILYNKALYAQCEKILDRAEKLAEENERLISMLEIISRKLKLLKTAYLYKTEEEELTRLYRKQQEIIAKTENLSTYQWLDNRVSLKVLHKGWMPRSVEEIEKEYTPIISHKLLEKEQNALTLKASMLQHNTLSVFYYLKGDMQASNRENIKLMEIFKKHPGMINTNMEDYILCLGNLIYNSIRMGGFKEAMQDIYKLKSLQPESVALKAKVVSSAYLPEMIIYNSSGQTKAAIALIPAIEKSIEEYGPYLAPRDVLYLYYNCACAHFKAGNFKLTSGYLARILNSGEIVMLPDIHANARILNLMVQYELEEFEILPYILRSTYRFLIQHSRLHKFEKNIISFIRKLTNVPLSGVTELFRQLQKELSALAQHDSYEKYAMEYFGITEWLESKL